MKAFVLLLALAACGGAREPQSEAAIANQAESLERAANATVDQQIAEIEAASNEAGIAVEGVVVPVDNEADATK